MLKIVLSLCLLVITFSTSDARPYIVIGKIVPVAIDPRAKYEISYKGMEIVDGIIDCAIYGNIIDAEPAKGRKYRKWLQVKAKDNELGFIEKKAAVRFPRYRRMKPEKFYIKRDNIQLYILPGRRSLSAKHGGITLPYGMTVMGVGSLRKKRVSWTLLRFENTEGLPIGMGERYGWVKTSQLQRF
jgi:hypothetical protein